MASSEITSTDWPNACLRWLASSANSIAAAKAIYGDKFEPRTTLRALSYFADGDLPKLPAAIQNALRTAAAGVKLDELPVLVGKPDLASRGDER